MKNNRFISGFLLAGLVFFTACKKEKPQEMGVTASLQQTSSHTGKDYAIDIFYPDNDFPQQPVPIVYLLDGYWYKEMAMQLLTDLSEQGEIPKCILVSIAYQDGGYVGRFSDLPYPDANEDPNFAGDKFFQFLKTELLPLVESQYPSDTSRRTLFGHSFGGVFTLCSLFENASQPLFKNCIAASTSIGLGTDNYIFTKEQNAADSINDLPVNLFMSYGSLEGPEMDILHKELYDRLLSRNYPSLDAELADYPKTHGSNVFPSLQNGLIYVFNH